jgi:tRNA(Leu) C34 or U34 (ribose-2'-O)-methylase TrmL
MREGGTRSLNLATAAAIVMYEAVRQRTLAGIAS